MTDKILTLLNSRRPDSAEDLFDKAAEVEEEPAAGK
jgi:hypothetical protein